VWSCAGFVVDVERVRIAGSTLHHSLCGCCVAGLICCEAGARVGDTVTSCHLPSARRCSRCSTCPSARSPPRTRAMLFHAMTHRQVMVSFAAVCGRVGGCSPRVTWCCRALGAALWVRMSALWRSVSLNADVVLGCCVERGVCSVVSIVRRCLAGRRWTLRLRSREAAAPPTARTPLEGRFRCSRGE
jgi:hypothetical protein